VRARPPILKRCAHCGAHKVLKDFSKDGQARDGLQSWCKVCNSSRKSSRPKADPLEHVWKVCTACHENKPLSDYFKDRASQYGVKDRCKECMGGDLQIVDVKNPAMPRMEGAINFYCRHPPIAQNGRMLLPVMREDSSTIFVDITEPLNQGIAKALGGRLAQ
jgi:hypothetical protein